MKRMLSVLLSLALLCACVPLGAIPVFADTSGIYGGCGWKLDNNGHLTIYASASGNGVMGGNDIGRRWSGETVTSVTIRNGVTNIASEAFYCHESLTSITIPDSVTEIGAYAFEGCTSLTSITIPDSVTWIGREAFDECNSLTCITVGAKNPKYSSLDGVLFDKSQTTLLAYPGGKIGAYTIPDSVTTIGKRAFQHCDSLTSVTIPNSVTTIEVRAFFDCDSLTMVTIPDSVTTIGSGSFCFCTYLTSVTIGNGVTTIEDSAFAWCVSLTSVTIPDSVTSIGEGAFDDFCTSLVDVYYSGSVVDRAKIAIGDDNTSLLDATWHYGVCIHTYADSITTPVTCGNDGVKTYTCSICGDIYTEAIPATGDHTYNHICDPDCNVCGAVREVPTPGDGDGDGKITTRDVALMQQYLAGWDVTLNETAGYADGEERVTTRDVALLQQHLAGWDVILGG